MKLSFASQVKLGLASPEVVEAFAERGRQWVYEQHIRFQEKKKRRPKRLQTDDEVLPNGVIVAGALIDYVENDESIREDYNRKQDLFNVFNNFFTLFLNEFLDEIIATGEVRIPGSSQVYYKIEGHDIHSTRYLNSAQLMYPTVMYVNRQLVCLGFAKQYGTNHSYTVREKSVALDMIVGLISVAVTGLSTKSASELLGVAEGLSLDVSTSVSEEAKSTIYNFLAPFYFFDPVGKRVQCAFNVVSSQMDEQTIEIVKTCSSSRDYSLTTRVGVDAFNVDFNMLELIIGGNKDLIDAAKEWFRRNEEANKNGVTEDPNAVLSPPPANARDVIA